MQISDIPEAGFITGVLLNNESEYEELHLPFDENENFEVFSSR